MKDNKPSSTRRLMIVMGLALGLPSTIVGLFFLLYQLVEKKIISWNLLLIILLVVVLNMLVLMVKNGLDKQNKH
jgi:hypothetical protein